MMLEDFFEANQTVIWTLEYLKCFMTSEIVGLESEYDIGDAVIAECQDISKRNMYPIVLVKLTHRQDPTSYDYLYFILATNSMGVWYGPVTYRAITPNEVGTDFAMMLSSGKRIGGKIAMRHNELCFQFQPDYYVEKDYA